MNRLRSALLIVSAVLLLSSTTAAQERAISFSPAKSFSAGIHNPSCVATGDFNGDGHPDFAVANHFKDLAVFLGNGDGTFQPPVTYSLDFYVIGCVAAGDFNNDHKLDLVVVGGSHGLAFLAGKGDGTFNAPVYTETTLDGGSVSLAVGDLNNDGNLDIFVGGNGSSEVLLGDGKGNFTEGQYVNGVRAFSVALGDFNKDGNLDAAVTDPISDTLYVLLGDGDGTFQTPHSYPGVGGFSGAGPPLEVVAADVNGDGNLDLVIASGIFPILWGDGAGNFTEAGVLNVPYNPVGNIIAADFNKDGKIDLAWAAGQPVVVGPCLSGTPSCPPLPPPPFGVAVTTGQGEDTCSSTISYPLPPPFFTIRICQPTPTTLFVTTSANRYQRVAAADFNKDGSPDLVVANSEDGTVSILLNEGGTFINIYKAEGGPERDELTLRVTVEGSVLSSVVPTGTVVFKSGPRVLGRVELENGKCSFTIEDFEEGLQNVQALYSGDKTFNPNEASVLIRSKSRDKGGDRDWSSYTAIRDGSDHDDNEETRDSGDHR